MVRHEYFINDLSMHDLNNTLEKTSANDPVNMPLDATWMVRWSRFFEIDGSRPNFSRRIGPYLSDGLGNDQIFPAFDETERVGLLYRDLLGAALAGMWSVDALIAEIAVAPAAFHRDVAAAGRPRLSGQPAPRMAGFGAGLWQADGRRHRNACERSAAAVLHPVRGDAAARAEGLRLGPLGSIIVSEVIFGALASESGSSRARFADRCARRLVRASITRKMFSQDVPEIERMAQLVEFTAEIADLKQAVPAFL